MSQRVAGLRDGLGMPVDKPIFDLVVILNILGFYTTGSCGGHIARTTSGPYVVFESKKARDYARQAKEVRDSNAAKYKALRKKANYQSALEQQRMLVLLEDFYRSREHTYDASTLIIQSMPLTYNCLKCVGAETALTLGRDDKKRLVEENRHEIRLFTEYLRSVYDR